MYFGWIPNIEIYGNTGLHKNYLKTKFFISKKQVPVESFKEAFV